MRRPRVEGSPWSVGNDDELNWGRNRQQTPITNTSSQTAAGGGPGARESSGFSTVQKRPLPKPPQQKSK